MSNPSFEQMQHFFRLVGERKITKITFQAFLEDPSRFVDNLLTTVDNTVGLIKMIETAVGPNNLGNINRDITPERFKLGDGIRKVKLQVERFRDAETPEECAKRLVTEGFTLENTGELASFLEQHPDEVEKFAWVFALGEASRWEHSDGNVSVPGARVSGADRRFNLDWFHRRYVSRYGVLVSVPSK